MAMIHISEEALNIATQEAQVAGVKPDALVERALRDLRLRRELQKAYEALDTGQVEPHNGMEEIIAEAKKEMEAES